MFLLLAFLIGAIAGLRAMMAPAVVAWAVTLQNWNLGDGWLSFMGHVYTPWVFTALALAELVTDQLPSTPSRKVPPQFIARILTGALCGGTIAATVGMMWPGLALGALGAVAGTYSGAWARGRLAAAFGRDRPAALIEDAVAILGAIAIVSLL